MKDIETRTEKEVAEEIRNLIETKIQVWETRSFEEEGFLTRDVGFVITMADGSRFEVTIQACR